MKSRGLFTLYFVNSFLRRVVIAVAIALYFQCLGVPAVAYEHPAASLEQGVAETVVPDQLMVKFRHGIGMQMRQAALAGVASRVRHFQDTNTGPGGRHGLPVFDQLVQVTLNPDLLPEQAIANLMRNPNIEYAEPAFVVDALETFPNDPDFDLLWGLKNTGQTGGTAGADISAPTAWDTYIGSSGVVVAVIDTGIDYTHPDLALNMWLNPDEIPENGMDDDGNGFVDDVFGYDFYNDDADPKDDHFHGTHCAGTIGAQGDNGMGVAGVNWTVSLMAVKFLSASGSGNTSDAVSAIQYAINNGANVMSNSWGGSGYSQALQDVITEAHNAGIVFVAAAGNNGSDTTVYPAAYDNVIAVSATDHNDVKASFSSYGTFVDVAAPGVNIYSTKLDGTYGYASGTSMACPHVAGLAALLKSLDIPLTPDQVEHILETTADDLGNVEWDTFYGSGRINALRALEAVAQQQTAFPTADISSPAEDQTVSGASLDIRGTAGGDGFVEYTVAYALTGDDTWNLIMSGTSPVTNGLLASWDISTLADGDYLIRLAVTDTYNRKIYDVVPVTIDSYDTVITSPTQFVTPGSVDITGSAATRNDMPFDAYTLEWGVGSAPTSFSTAGIMLINDGQSPVIDGTLAVWDTSGLTDGQTYTLRLTVFSALGGQSETSARIRVDTDLVEGWPMVLSTTSNEYIIPTVADLDGDGNKEIITAGPDEQIRVYRKDGSAFPGFPVVMNDGDYFRWAVNVDDLDGDGTKEIIAVASNFSSYPRSRILIIRHDGTPYPGWSTPGLTLSVSSSDVTPTVADLNGDGSKELVVLEIVRYVTQSNVTLHAFGLSGTEVAGFPKQLTLPPTTFDPDTDMYPSKHGVLSIADLDRDGHPEIAWSYSNRIYLFDHQGNVLPGWPFIAPDYNGKIMLFENAAASGDIDGDGQLELFSIGRGHNCGGCETQLYGWRKDGSVLAGWPKTDQSDDIVLWNITGTQNTPVLVDTNEDGKDEVIVGLGQVTVFDQTGRVPFATNNITTDTQPCPSDADGDGKLEFSTFWYNTISIMDDDGSAYWTRSMSSSSARKTLGLLSDLDNDGFMELVYVHADFAPSTTLYVWEIPRLGSNPAAGEWPMFNHDPARTGRQGPAMDLPQDDTAPVCAIHAPAHGSTVSGDTLVEMSASDNVGVTRVELYLDDSLMGTVSTEPYSLSWDTFTASNGDHTLLARAFDAAGNVGTSSPVTVQVNNDTPPPDTPVLLSPADGSTTDDATPVFDWSDVGDPGEIRYHVQVDNQADFSSPEVDANDLVSSSYTPVQDLSDGTYSWRVLAVDGAGKTSAWSPASTLTINTQPPDTCVPGDPLVSVSPASQSAGAGTTLDYAVSVSNTDSGTCATSTFSLSRIIPDGWTGMLSPATLSLAPGQTGQATLTVTSTQDADPGTYALNVTASDVSGQTRNSSGDATYGVVESERDTEPPTAPADLWAAVSGKKVLLSWTAATDDTGVTRYTVWRDGTQIDAALVTEYDDKTVSPGEIYTYMILAYDAAGNISSPSNSVTITVENAGGQKKPKD